MFDSVTLGLQSAVCDSVKGVFDFWYGLCGDFVRFKCLGTAGFEMKVYDGCVVWYVTGFVWVLV